MRRAWMLLSGSMILLTLATPVQSQSSLTFRQGAPATAKVVRTLVETARTNHQATPAHAKPSAPAPAASGSTAPAAAGVPAHLALAAPPLRLSRPRSRPAGDSLPADAARTLESVPASYRPLSVHTPQALCPSMMADPRPLRTAQRPGPEIVDERSASEQQEAPPAVLAYESDPAGQSWTVSVMMHDPFAYYPAYCAAREHCPVHDCDLWADYCLERHAAPACGGFSRLNCACGQGGACCCRGRPCACSCRSHAPQGQTGAWGPASEPAAGEVTPSHLGSPSATSLEPPPYEANPPPPAPPSSASPELRRRPALLPGTSPRPPRNAPPPPSAHWGDS